MIVEIIECVHCNTGTAIPSEQTSWVQGQPNGFLSYAHKMQPLDGAYELN